MRQRLQPDDLLVCFVPLFSHYLLCLVDKLTINSLFSGTAPSETTIRITRRAMMAQQNTEPKEGANERTIGGENDERTANWNGATANGNNTRYTQRNHSLGTSVDGRETFQMNFLPMRGFFSSRFVCDFLWQFRRMRETGGADAVHRQRHRTLKPRETRKVMSAVV